MTTKWSNWKITFDGKIGTWFTVIPLLFMELEGLHLVNSRPFTKASCTQHERTDMWELLPKKCLLIWSRLGLWFMAMWQLKALKVIWKLLVYIKTIVFYVFFNVANEYYKTDNSFNSIQFLGIPYIEVWITMTSIWVCRLHGSLFRGKHLRLISVVTLQIKYTIRYLYLTLFQCSPLALLRIILTLLKLL